MDKPIYQTLVDNLIEEIDQAPANSPISSERELADRFQVSRMTARRALKELVLLGYVYTNKNKGTFVADKKLRRRTGPDVLNVPQESYQILYFDIKHSDEQILKELALTTFDSYARIVRVNTKNATNASIDEIYISTKYLSAEKVEAIDFLQTFTNHASSFVGTRTFIPMMVPTKYAKLLSLPLDTLIIQMESTYLSNQGKPYIYCRTFNHPTLAKIKISI